MPDVTPPVPPTELTAEQVAAMAAQPASFSNGQESTSTRSADDIIKLDQYAQQKKAAGVTDPKTGRRASPLRFLQPVQVIPPGGL